ncbi:MAG TPA: hypothetical protein VJM09_06680 [Sphingobium sp.]|nr:hypothetical protein [Sphingobium sp.]
MRRAIHLLLLMAVLWCGLHLSRAEADETAWAAAETSAHVQADGDISDDHSQPHVSHGCHSHCPIAPDLDMDLAFEFHARVSAVIFPLPSLPLTSAAQAPPLEPPSA